MSTVEVLVHPIETCYGSTIGLQNEVVSKAFSTSNKSINLPPDVTVEIFGSFRNQFIHHEHFYGWVDARNVQVP